MSTARPGGGSLRTAPFRGWPGSQLLGEHLVEPAKDRGDRLGRQPTEPLDQTVGINSSDLIEGHNAHPPLEPAGHPPRVHLTARCHRRHHGGAQIGVELVGRNDHTGPGLANLTAERRIEAYQMHLTPGDPRSRYHVHSSSSNRVAVGASRRVSSPRLCIARAASAQPARGRRAARTTRRPGCACSSTSSGSSACSNNARGTRIP